ncbi:YcaO-like family protein [Kutzneria buriramensis]|uniref:Ribosomal protein S12 methylthiotransferase accessory factor n=1 Tax=Kutzneria buriramensis TaxID=1045776 RepID=A0A3E0H2Z6_9PSEU|nr:YcaO-like family protein [Kutzneria buriramensis]REH37226.1 ribosomal protein S12 methylthiotransferase accessory factor [Kutzneria buriramensis]
MPVPAERGLPLDTALARGLAAVGELGLTADFSPLLDADPGSWRCSLRHCGVGMEAADGIGRGDRETARVGALFEALEHYLSGLDGLRNRQVRLRDAHEVANGPLAADPLVRRLGEGPARELGCVRYQALDGSPDVDVPVFLTIPEYRGRQGEATRLKADDFYDYTAADRCLETSGWAAGSYAAEALVHAVNEAIERDALAQLVAEQFIGQHTPPLCAVDPATLPDDLADLLITAADRSGRSVHLIDMTSDVGVPAYFAFQAPESGGSPTAVGSAAGLCGHVAAARALTELIQCQTTPTVRRLPDFTGKLPDATSVEFVGADGPTTPRQHLDVLVELLQSKGFTPYAREQYSTRNVAVVNVFVPGLNRSTDCRSLRVSRRCAQAPTG